MRSREEPGPGQESVWDYPRPPALVPSTRRITVWALDANGNAHLVAETTAAYRVLETSHPPTWYVPRADVVAGALTPSRAASTWCEWKGAATYWDVFGIPSAGWSYEQPTGGFVDITGHLAFSPAMLRCEVDGEQARPQPGGFYAGWITDDVVGPVKGGPGTWGW